MMKHSKQIRVASFLLLSMTLFSGISYAKSAKEIDASVDVALERFQQEVFGAKDLIAQSKAVLVLPKVIKAGFGLGGEYGMGALRMNGKSEAYYKMIGGSFGFQLGVQVKSVYLLFMEDTALRNFRYSDGWQAGADGSVALIKMGTGASVDTTKTNEPIIAYVLGQKGLMYNLTLEGSKFNKIKPD